jgi:hypothetical protein
MLFGFYFIPGNDNGSFENVPFALSQIIKDYPLMIVVVVSALSSCFSAVFSLIITKRMDASSRSTINSMRTFFIWCSGLVLKWEKFYWYFFFFFKLLFFMF